MDDIMEKAKAMLNTKRDTSNKDEVAAFLSVFYPKMNEEKRRNVLRDVQD